METIALPLRQQLFAFIAGSVLLIMIVELIRRRRMLEQYSAIWFIIGLFSMTFIWWYPMVEKITRFIGAGYTTSTILFFGLLASLLLILQLCVKISDFSHKLKDMIQEMAIVNHELQQLRRRCAEMERGARERSPASEPNPS